MKVALLGPYPQSELAGGVDAVMRALVSGLVTRGDVDLHVVSSVPGLRRPEVLRQHGWFLHRVPHLRGDRLLWHQPAVWPVRRALAEIAPDVVHAHMAGHYADAALRSGKPTLITLHGVVFREAALALARAALPVRLRWQLDALFERWVIGRARDIIAISPYVAEEYRPFTRARFHAIENPVADEFFTVPEAVPGLLATPRLLCVARVIPRKDILTLLAVFGRVLAAWPQAQLEIAGSTTADPQYAALCQNTAEGLGLIGKVHFLGDLNGRALLDAYARADVVLLTSRQETAPVAVAEAMAAGRPVVATSVGGLPFMVADGITGKLAAPADAAGFAQAVLSLLGDPDLRLACGRAARAAAEERFRLRKVVARTVDLYRQLLSERERQGAG